FRSTVSDAAAPAFQESWSEKPSFCNPTDKDWARRVRNTEHIPTRPAKKNNKGSSPTHIIGVKPRSRTAWVGSFGFTWHTAFEPAAYRATIACLPARPLDEPPMKS